MAGEELGCVGGNLACAPGAVGPRGLSAQAQRVCCLEPVCRRGKAWQSAQSHARGGSVRGSRRYTRAVVSRATELATRVDEDGMILPTSRAGLALHLAPDLLITLS